MGKISSRRRVRNLASPSTYERVEFKRAVRLASAKRIELALSSTSCGTPTASSCGREFTDQEKTKSWSLLKTGEEGRILGDPVRSALVRESTSLRIGMITCSTNVGCYFASLREATYSSPVAVKA